jgi:hypothetical protein
MKIRGFLKALLTFQQSVFYYINDMVNFDGVEL